MSWDCLLVWIEGHPGLASWVQAVGSIAALFLAVWLSGSERRHRSKIERAARMDLIERAIAAAEHAKKITQNNVEFFTSNSLPRSQMPQYLAVINHAYAQVRGLEQRTDVDSQVAGHLAEVANSLVDVKSQVESCVDSLESDISGQIAYMKSNVHRIQRAIDKLGSIKA